MRRLLIAVIALFATFADARSAELTGDMAVLDTDAQSAIDRGD